MTLGKIGAQLLRRLQRPATVALDKKSFCYCCCFDIYNVCKTWLVVYLSSSSNGCTKWVGKQCGTRWMSVRPGGMPGNWRVYACTSITACTVCMHEYAFASRIFFKTRVFFKTSRIETGVEGRGNLLSILFLSFWGP